jgi:hypothetical protein
MARSEVADTLARWRAASRQADSTPAGSHDRAAAETEAERLHREYLAAVLRMTGGRDQVEGAIETSGRRPTGTFEVIERSQEREVEAERATEPA